MVVRGGSKRDESRMRAMCDIGETRSASSSCVGTTLELQTVIT